MANDLLQIAINTDELLEYSRRLKAAERVTSTAIAASLNAVGDDVVATVSTNLARQTGLQLEQVRGLLRVRRATRGRLEYEINVAESLLSDKTSPTLEGKRERGFGPFKPGQMVIVVTQKDELVCMDCEELGAAGPMPAEIALEHVPKHPNCRCVIMPYVQKGRRLPVRMTTLSGTDPTRRMGRPLDEQATLRQLAQDIINRTSKSIRIQLR